MLPRTLVLLLLCVSSGMCATLGYIQAQAEEREEALALELAAAAAAASAASTEDIATSDNVPTSDDVATSDDVPTSDDAATSDDVATSDDAAPSDNVAASDNLTANPNETEAATVDAQVEDSPATEAPTVNPIFGDKPLAKILGVENPAVDKPEAEVQAADAETTQESEIEAEVAAGDPPAAGESVTQEIPSSEDKEANQIEPAHTKEIKPLEEESGWGISSIRSSFQTAHGYFDSLVELVGGRNGVCQYRCRYGQLPQPRPGYQLPEPNGCSSSLVGFQLDLGIPAMTKCCNELDLCYDTCGTSKYDCDTKFRSCLHDICFDFNKSLGFESKVQACESMADALYNTVWTLGCRPYMNSQRAACICEGEEKDEL